MRKIIIVAFMLLFICRHAAAGQVRIISIAPATTEIACALGLEDDLVAVSTYCDYPPEVKSKEKIGSFSEPNIEKILILKPDIILATGLEQAQAVGKLKTLGLRVMVSDPKNFRELYDSILAIGKACGKDTEAVSLMNKMKKTVSAVSAKVAPVEPDKRPKVYFEIWHDPIMTAGKGSFIDEMITVAGGVNITYDAPRPFSQFSPELIVKRDPDVIILGYMVKGEGAAESLSKRFGWDKITAVRKGRVYDDIEPDILFRPGPRLADAVVRLNERFYK
ncbi:MAG: cobalamin-binding protein [Candidatus Omnitrophica bacterium]|nr:cobalamin-binding protein [Candidatus Omnitrophota bacterium]MDD5310675.1 cobalamin-binding protein [Candidatus Omnitrophota bacterium]